MTRAADHSEAVRRPYEPPRIVAYDENELMDIIGPAVACARWTGASLSEEEQAFLQQQGQ
jgi:hypothetical protein